MPSAFALLSFATAYFFLLQAARTLHVGIANALWSGFSVIVVAMIGSCDLGSA